MSYQLGSSRFRGLLDAALQHYEKTTNISLAEHPLAEQLHSCHAVDSITTFLQDKAREFGDFPGSDRAMNAIKNTVSILSMLSSTAVLGDLVCPKLPMQVLYL
jgi:hypothetical protein